MRFVVLYKGNKAVGYAGPFRNGPEAEKWGAKAVKLSGGKVSDMCVFTLSDPDKMLAQVMEPARRAPKENKSLPFRPSPL